LLSIEPYLIESGNALEAKILIVTLASRRLSHSTAHLTVLPTAKGKRDILLVLLMPIERALADHHQKSLDIFGLKMRAVHL
jgi:hypothetical protein